MLVYFSHTLVALEDILCIIYSHTFSCLGLSPCGYRPWCFWARFHVSTHTPISNIIHIFSLAQVFISYVLAYPKYTSLHPLYVGHKKPLILCFWYQGWNCIHTFKLHRTYIPQAPCFAFHVHHCFIFCSISLHLQWSKKQRSSRDLTYAHTNIISTMLL